MAEGINTLEVPVLDLKGAVRGTGMAVGNAGTGRRSPVSTWQALLLNAKGRIGSPPNCPSGCR